MIFQSDTPLNPCVATIGTFDGVHLGHRHVVGQVVNIARSRHLEAVVVTFPNHPLEVIRSDFPPQMLTLADEKRELLQQTGIDRTVMMPFTETMAQMTAFDFMRTILRDQLNVQVLVLGYDNHFGHDHRGFDDCLDYGRQLGIEVVECKELPSSLRVSSTAIRQALLEGDVSQANTLLGHPYFLQGTVIAGFQNGRKLGYPTANLQVDAHKLIPQSGAYFVETPVGWGMLNIGTRPTLHNGTQRSIEVHLFDFKGDLYGQRLRVELLQHLRPERQFATLEELQHQLSDDEHACRTMMRDL